MYLFDIILIAIGISMDCFAVSIACGVKMKRFELWPFFRIALFFAILQSIMPLLGWLAGNTFKHLIEDVDHWIAFGILFLLGIRMIYEQFYGLPEKKILNPYRFNVVFILALATSIDALAVGLSFAILKINLSIATLLIFITTFIFSILGLLIGHQSRFKIRLPAELIGGIVLISIGTKILLEHLVL